jgi:hypothetical protein
MVIEDNIFVPRWKRISNWQCLVILIFATVGDAAETVEFPDVFENQYAATFEDFVERSTGLVDGRTIRAWIPGSEVSKPEVCGDEQLESGGKQAYLILVDDLSISVCANSPAGLVHGTSDLQNLIATKSLQSMRTIQDPKIETRALHIVLRNISIENLYDTVRRARLARFNTLIIMLTNGVALDAYPSALLRNAISKQELREFVQFARQNGLDVIPEIKLLTHQQVFLQSNSPELMFNKATYDPRNTKVYELVTRYIDEVISLVSPTAIHIGHDEVRAFGVAAKRRWLNAGEQPLSADLFLRDVRTLNKILTDRGVGVWMWADMLLPKEMLAEILQRNFDERADYPKLLSKMPKNIVMVDWRYFDQSTTFPSIDYFEKHGFRILGATWHDISVATSFANYMSSRKWQSRGMVATTWSLAPRGEWGLVHKIINQSGKAFWGGG